MPVAIRFEKTEDDFELVVLLRQGHLVSYVRVAVVEDGRCFQISFLLPEGRVHITQLVLEVSVRTVLITMTVKMTVFMAMQSITIILLYEYHGNDNNGDFLKL